MRTADAILSLAFLALCHCSLNPQPLPPDTANDAGSDFTTQPSFGVDSGKATTTGMGGQSSSGSLTEEDAGDLGGATADGGHGEDGAVTSPADATVDAGPDGAYPPPPPDDGGTKHDGATTDAPLPHDAAEEAQVGHDATI